jgi:hypothetical protein
MQPALILAAVVAAAALPPAGAQTIYKYVCPNGRVTSSQTPALGARSHA